MEIGAHTVTHPQLDTLRAPRLDRELRESKAVLEDVLGHEVAHLAYPHGYNSRAVRRAARRAGYASAVAVRHALSSGADEPYRIARLIVRRSHTVADVTAWLAGRARESRRSPTRPRRWAGASTAGPARRRVGRGSPTDREVTEMYERPTKAQRVPIIR